jgi:hypothetical protein
MGYGQRRSGEARAAEPLSAQSHALGNDKAAPDAMLANIPVPQRQLQRAIGHVPASLRARRRTCDECHVRAPLPAAG